MRALQRSLAVLIWPAIAWMGTACNQTDAPSEPQSPGPAMALSGSNTLWVNDDGIATPTGTSCNNPNYNRIQDAVTAASAGYRINVCPGTYVEQVTIPATKDDIKLRSTKQWEAVIQAPAIMVPVDGKFTIVRITGAQNVTVLAFTITGPGPGFCGSLHYGVRVDDGGSGNILGNHITDIRDQITAGELSGCQNGMGVVVGKHFNDLDQTSTGSARIEGNLIEHYQKNGVVVGTSGSSAIITANRVLGFGPSATIAQNGIEVIDGATAEIKHNFSSGHIFTPQFVTPTGVLLFSAGTVDINHNTVAQNDVNVYAFASATGSATSATHNRVRASTFDGIVVDATNDATVGANFTELNGGPGIGLYDGATGNTVANNQTERNSNNFSSATDFGGGILLHNASSNTISGNHIRNNGTANNLDNTDGIRVNEPSTGNTIQGNHLRGNVTHDCHDATTLGSNTWVDNHGETSSPAGLCSDPDPQDDFAVEAGWNPGYPWYSGYELATEFDWPSLYSAIDVQIQGLLELLPRLGFGGVRRPSP